MGLMGLDILRQPPGNGTLVLFFHQAKVQHQGQSRLCFADKATGFGYIFLPEAFQHLPIFLSVIGFILILT